MTQCNSYRFKWHKHVFRIQLVGKTQPRSKLEQGDYKIYKIPKDMQDESPGHIIHIKKSENTSNRR